MVQKLSPACHNGPGANANQRMSATKVRHRPRLKPIEHPVICRFSTPFEVVAELCRWIWPLIVPGENTVGLARKEWVHGGLHAVNVSVQM